MPPSVVFARHGESTANIDRVFANRMDLSSDLTEAGIAHARHLANALRDVGVAEVLTSPLARAEQTAAIVATALGVPVRVEPALREYDVGDYEGEPYGGDHAWRMARYDAIEAAWRAGDRDAAHPPRGESLTDILTRFGGLMDDLAEGSRETGLIVAIGHGGLYRVALPWVLDNIWPDFAQTHPLGHGDTVEAHWERNAWRCVRWATADIPPRRDTDARDGGHARW